MSNRITAFFIVLLQFVVPGSIEPSPTDSPFLRIQVVDASSNRPIPDAVMTVDGAVIAPGSRDGEYSVPEHASSLAVRAPGYRAKSLAPKDAAQFGNKLPLTALTVRALFLTEYGIAAHTLRDPALEIIRRGIANALVINIKSDRGLLPYPSNIGLASAIGARKLTTIPSLSALVRMGHDQGIYMIARIVTFKDDPLASAHPELAIRNANGSLFRDREHLSWTDPFKPQVRAYNIAIAVEAAQAGFDEVQFDYVRFPDATTKLKLSGPTDEASRIKAITLFLTEAKRALASYNVFESVDIFGYVSWNTTDTGIGQHLEEITQVVDYVCPMLYPSGFKYGIPGHRNPLATDEDIYSTVKLSLDESLRRTKANPKKFRPWLQAFRDYAFNRREFGPAEVAIQIRAATDADADGWSLWNARNQYGNIGFAKPPDKLVFGTYEHGIAAGHTP